jgi:hypothetical protein
LDGERRNPSFSGLPTDDAPTKLIHWSDAPTKLGLAQHVRSLACGKVGIEIHDLRPTHGSCRGKKGNPKPPNGLRRLRSKWPIYLCSALGIQTLEHRGSCMWNKRLFQDEWGTAALTTKTWLAMVHLVRHFDGDVP